MLSFTTKTVTRRCQNVWKVAGTFLTPLFYSEKWCDLLAKNKFEINVLSTLKVRDAAYGLSSWANALLSTFPTKVGPNMLHNWGHPNNNGSKFKNSKLSLRCFVDQNGTFQAATLVSFAVLTLSWELFEPK